MTQYTEEPSTSMALVIKADSDALSLVEAARKAVMTLDAEQPVANVRTMEQRLNASLAQRHFHLFLLGAFAALSLVLAAIGIYGVMSYSVDQRNHEIGVRIALGATRRDVLSLFLGRGMVLSLMGVGLGIAGALILTRLLTSLLYGVQPTDPVTFITVSLMLIGVALAATYFPARRATKVDPMVVLKCE
jgi:putative ABC transport system permease protein